MATTGLWRREKALTAKFVESARVPGKYFDEHGLYLRVKPNDARQWVQRIVIRGKRRELGQGNPSLVPLAGARVKALENRKLAQSGGNPIQAKRENKAVLTFEEAARKVHALHLPTWCNAKHAAQFISTLETFAFPRMSKLKVGNINTSDVLAALSPIWTEKSETAARVKQFIGTVIKWAVTQGWRQDNPAQSIAQALPKRDKSKQEHRKALPYFEMVGCVETVPESNTGLSTNLALEFLVLTATRSGETRGAQWSEIDLGTPATPALWTIPASRTKAKRDHRFPLSSRAVEILREAAKLTNATRLVLPGTKAGKALSNMTLSKLVKELGFDADIHGFRNSFRTWAQERTNYPREVAEAALPHTINDYAVIDTDQDLDGMVVSATKMEDVRSHFAQWPEGLALLS